MSSERIEKSPHRFWFNTCQIDTYHRSSQHARHDTPWNAFSPDQVLVCTLWEDQIAKVFDPQSGRTRRFVRIGGKLRAWKGPAVAHGEEANRNLRRATELRLRVVGYEAEPEPKALARGDRKVGYFYLDRAHELQRVFDLSGADMIERLGLNQAFDGTRRGSRVDEIEPGYLFELVEPKGAFPGAPHLAVAPAADDVDDVAAVVTDVEEEGHEPDDDDLHLFDETGEATSTTEEHARKSIPILIEHVLKQRDGFLVPLTYKHLAERLNRRNKHGVFWARGLGRVLGRVTALVDALKTDWAEPIPYLTTIVVSSQGPSRGLPGVGIRGKWAGYDRLTRSEKELKVMAEHQRVLAFGSRWNDVLALLGMPTVLPPQVVSGTKGGWGGGESDQHKALKLFVKNNPHLVGADATWATEDEYPLRSGDEIDVFFRSDQVWIGVEVKSSISDGLERDYERGLYQVVKYKAVLSAQALVDRPSDPAAVKVVLVLETALPKKYLVIAKSLGIEVKENVKPPIGAETAVRSASDISASAVV